ncbi:MAG: polyprenyl synthetase family protein [Myxococcota bacterium]|nr:polyprenyl synthetase family protein [Myxococcota bacterium]
MAQEPPKLEAGASYQPRLHRGLKKLVRPLLREVERAVDQVEEPLGRVETALAHLALGDQGQSPDSHIAPGVPRIRPILVLLASRAAGEDNAVITEAVFSAELLEQALWVHDAALGRQDGRRRRIARRLLGGAAHWLGGHNLTLRALEVARAAPSPEILGEALDTVREISEGHELAVSLRDRDATEDDWREYAESHNGAVFAFCTRSGGRLARAPRPVLSALGRYGRSMGVAWHAVEDQWVFSLPPDEFLRVLARRLATGRPLLPLIVALEQDPALDLMLDRLLARGGSAQARELQQAVLASEGIQVARRMQVEASFAARRSLRALQPSEHRDTLDRLAASLALTGGPITLPEL